MTDPVRLSLAHALGAIQDAGRLLKRAPDTAGLVDRLRQIARELAARLEGMPLQEALELQVGKEDKRPPWQTAELDWRVQDTVQAHMRAFKEWRRRTNGAVPNGQHDLPDPVKKVIREALLVYDRELLAPEKRDEWRKESRVRAAGIGIFYDPWCTGNFPEGQGEKPKEWAGPYVEHDRPWRRRAGKADPIMRFSERYFEERDLA